jgi:hypothetical protein
MFGGKRLEEGGQHSPPQLLQAVDVVGKEIVLHVTSIFALVGTDDRIILSVEQLRPVHGFPVAEIEVAAGTDHISRHPDRGSA